MILPASHASVLLLLITSLICLGCWINTFKAAGSQWRFELFSIDFALGGLLVVLVAAFTLGALGSDLGFSDRILVAGRTAQALAFVAGAAFNLGNMLLLAAVGLIGISTAFPISFGIALIFSSCFYFRADNYAYLLIGIALLVVGIIFEMRSATMREAAPQNKVAAPVAHTQSAAPTSKPAAASVSSPTATVRQRVSNPPRKKKRSKRSSRGILSAILAGVAFGMVNPILQNCIPGDLGLGAYSGMLLFGIAVLVSTIIYNFYFLNITIDGSPLTFAAYAKGTAGQHFLGFVGGALCLGGLLAAELAAGAPASVDISSLKLFIFPAASTLLAIFFGLTVWKELSGASGQSRTALLGGIVLFAVSLGVLAFGVTR